MYLIFKSKVDVLENNPIFCILSYRVQTLQYWKVTYTTFSSHILFFFPPLQDVYHAPKNKRFAYLASQSNRSNCHALLIYENIKPILIL